MVAPLPFDMKIGVPPTCRKARTGLETPPGNNCCARANSSSERLPEGFVIGGLLNVVLAALQVRERVVNECGVEVDGTRGDRDAAGAPPSAVLHAEIGATPVDERAKRRRAAALEDAQEFAFA